MEEFDGLLTTDAIMAKFEEMAKENMPIDPTIWINGAMKLNALSGNDYDRMIDLNSNVNKLKSMIIEDGKTSAYAKIKVEASDEYRDYLRQKAKIDRIMEMIRLAKLRARIGQEEYRNS